MVGNKAVYRNIQAMRGVAASMVMAGHAGALGVISVPGIVHTFFYSGVDVFFAISGFIVSTMAVRQSSTPWQFFVKRLFRIYPTYWCVLAISAVVGFWIPVGEQWMPRLSAVDYIFLLARYNWFVPPAWTLMYEIYFYTGIGCILIVAPRFLYPVIGALMCGQAIVVAGILWTGGDPDAYFATSAFVLEFGLGCAVAWLIGRGRSRLAIPAIVISLVFFALGAIWTKHDGLLASAPRLVTFGIGSAVLLYAMVALEGRLVLPVFLQRLGDASFALYIFHYLVLKVAAHVLPREEGYGVAVIGALILTSIIWYRYIERPMLSVFYQWVSRSESVNNMTCKSFG